MTIHIETFEQRNVQNQFSICPDQNSLPIRKLVNIQLSTNQGLLQGEALRDSAI